MGKAPVLNTQNLQHPHANEDYVHLLGGIRRVGEAVELLRLGEGSRIGHAVALGVDVEE